MNYAIIGTGKEGQALARKQIEVAIASRRQSEVAIFSCGVSSQYVGPFALA